MSDTKFVFTASVIVIMKKSTNEPALYYNHIRDKWVSESQNGCAFTKQEDADKKIIELDIDGATVISGKMTMV